MSGTQEPSALEARLADILAADMPALDATLLRELARPSTPQPLVLPAFDTDDETAEGLRKWVNQ